MPPAGSSRPRPAVWTRPCSSTHLRTLDRLVKFLEDSVAVTNAAPTEAQRVDELIDDLLATHDPKTTPPAEFLGAQYDRGLAWVQFPEGFGGLGASPKLQNTINARLTAAGAPSPYARNPIGYG